MAWEYWSTSSRAFRLAAWPSGTSMVPGLKVESVSLEDTEGNDYSGQSTGVGTAAASSALKIKLERQIRDDFEKQIHQALDPIYGENNVLPLCMVSNTPALASTTLLLSSTNPRSSPRLMVTVALRTSGNWQMVCSIRLCSSISQARFRSAWVDRALTCSTCKGEVRAERS